MVSIIIPARNEIYLQKTIESILAAAAGKIEIIVILDGYNPDPQIVIDDARVTFIHHEKSIGQRAAVNEGAKVAKGEYVLKTDGHSMFDKGFDVKLAADCEYDWTVIPRMYNLDVNKWAPKYHKLTDYMFISNEPGRVLRAEYYVNKGYRQPSGPSIDDVMTGQGACFFMHKKRFFELGGLDEKHGGWGQVGVEIALKAWLSGGSLKVNKNTWFSHWFRGGSGPGFPYKIRQRDVDIARNYSRDLWLNNKWEGQKRDFKWVIDKFNPPGWVTDMTILFYTANVVSDKIMHPVVRSLKKHGYPIISVSQKPMSLGKNILFEGERSLQNIYRQVLIAAKAAKTEYVALCEDDCIYLAEHFKFRPSETGLGYNTNRWLLHLDKGVYSYRNRPVLSQLIAHRKTLIKNLNERFKLAEIPDKHCGEPGCFEKKLGMIEYPFEVFKTDKPNLVVCHSKGIQGRKLLGKDAKPVTELEPWGGVKYWLKKFGAKANSVKPQQRKVKTSRFETRRGNQHCHIGGQTFKVTDIYNNRMDFGDPRKVGSLKRFMDVFPPFMAAVHEGVKFHTTVNTCTSSGCGIDGKFIDNRCLNQEAYYEYLVGKLNPSDRKPEKVKVEPWDVMAKKYTDNKWMPTCFGTIVTQKGHNHCIALMKDAIKLYKDIKKNGLRNPLDMWRHGDKLVLHRGGRRLEILKLLGWETAPCRIFNSREIFIAHTPDRDALPDKSIHGLAMQQFMRLKDFATDKFWVHSYTKLYDKHIGHLRNQSLKILEIGIFRGASLLLWKEAFPKAEIYGVDKDRRRCKAMLESQDRITTCIGRQEDEAFLRKEVIPNGKFDIIIDDGGHRPLPMQASFRYLWSNLNNSGIYVIEDLYGNYRSDKLGNTTMNLLKDLIDEMNIKSSIKSMTFYYNICFIEKN